MENLSIREQFDQMVEKNKNIDKFVDEYVEVLNNKTDSYNFYTSRGRRYIKITEVVVDRNGKIQIKSAFIALLIKTQVLFTKPQGGTPPQKAQDMIF